MHKDHKKNRQTVRVDRDSEIYLSFDTNGRSDFTIDIEGKESSTIIEMPAQLATALFEALMEFVTASQQKYGTKEEH